MCGIAAIINKDSVKVKFELIKKMTDLVSHRGPNGEGHYFFKNIALGHRRLSIIDLSDDGHQPMVWQDKYVITFNGEVYNYIEIREELIKLGYKFKSKSDTEVILAAYDAWGIDCFNRFNGMWAIVIIDQIQNKVICSRDRFGVKPIYFYENTEYFVLGSEIKQILPFLPAIEGNKKVISNYLFLNMTDNSEETFFKDIFTLRGGHLLVFDLDSNNKTISPFYTIKFDPKVRSLSYEAAKSIFLDKFNNSINLRLRSDVPVGTCLSGGLDSSFIASIAGEKYFQASGLNFKAITAGSIDEEVNEVDYAKAVARSSNLDWYVVKPELYQFWQDINNIITCQEEPFGNPTVGMQYYVMKKAKESGITVLLDGQGGDETLLGYDRYAAAIIAPLGLIDKIKYLIKYKTKFNFSILNLVKNYLWFGLPTLKIIRAKWQMRNVNKSVSNAIDFDTIKKLSSKYKKVEELQTYEICTSQIPQLLKWEDKNSMRFSIETRLPFLDYQFLEFCVSLPHDYKNRLGWTKYIIRDTMPKSIPGEVRWRKNKLGFNAPLRTFLNEEKQKEMLNTINNSPIIHYIFNGELNFDTNNIYYLWRLYNLAKWADIFEVKLLD